VFFGPVNVTIGYKTDIKVFAVSFSVSAEISIGALCKYMSVVIELSFEMDSFFYFHFSSLEAMMFMRKVCYIYIIYKDDIIFAIRNM
jgi:hypothetical protein